MRQVHFRDIICFACNGGCLICTHSIPSPEYILKLQITNSKLQREEKGKRDYF
jgi:hypothetical protein